MNNRIKIKNAGKLFLKIHDKSPGDKYPGNKSPGEKYLSDKSPSVKSPNDKSPKFEKNGKCPKDEKCFCHIISSKYDKRVQNIAEWHLYDKAGTHIEFQQLSYNAL
jgi:hypothetical protein